jgi:membrane protein YqaA with SNARE-associated domain
LSAALLLALALLFADGATLGLFTTFILIEAGKTDPPLALATLGGAVSALGSAVQLLVLRWLLRRPAPWARRLAPSRRKLEDALARYRRASFLGVVFMRATPVPDLPIKLVAAAGGYPVGLYTLAVWIGAMPYYYLLAKAGQVLHPPWWAIAGGVVVIALAAWLEKWRRARRS